MDGCSRKGSVSPTGGMARKEGGGRAVAGGGLGEVSPFDI